MLLSITQTSVKHVQLVYKSGSRLCNSTDLMTPTAESTVPKQHSDHREAGIGGQRNKQPMLLWQSRCLCCLFSPYGMRVNNTMTHTSRRTHTHTSRPSFWSIANRSDKDTEPNTCGLVGWVSIGMIAAIKQRKECSLFNHCSLPGPFHYRIWHRDISAIPRRVQSWQTQSRRCTKDSHDP